MSAWSPQFRMQIALSPPKERPRRRIAVVWTNFGPYHLARIRALAQYFRVLAIELAAFERLYGWQTDKSEIGAEMYTMREGDWEDQRQLSVAASLWRKLNALQPDAILVPGYATAPAIAAALWGKLHNARTVLMSESNAADHQRRDVLEIAKKLLVKTLFDCAVVGGKRAQEYACELGIRQTAIGIGYDVVDNDFFASRAEKERLLSGQNPPSCGSAYFLYVGRLAQEKNLSGLIEAFASYRARGGDWQLVVVGDGFLRDELTLLARARLVSEHVVFAGHRAVAELAAFYARAGCFVLPSLREPWGLVVNEAMASGLPVIVSNHCGCSDDLVQEGDNGFVFDPSNRARLTELLSHMSSLSVPERARMSSRSSEIIGRYSPALWAKEVYRIVSSSRN